MSYASHVFIAAFQLGPSSVLYATVQRSFILRLWEAVFRYAVGWGSWEQTSCRQLWPSWGNGKKDCNNLKQTSSSWNRRHMTDGLVGFITLKQSHSLWLTNETSANEFMLHRNFSSYSLLDSSLQATPTTFFACISACGVYIVCTHMQIVYISIWCIALGCKKVPQKMWIEKSVL